MFYTVDNVNEVEHPKTDEIYEDNQWYTCGKTVSNGRIEENDRTS